MTIEHRFSAPGKQDSSTLRRATNNAFTDLVTQLNREQVVAKAGPTLPVNPEQGQIFYLTTTQGSNSAGFYGYNGTTWQSLS